MFRTNLFPQKTHDLLKNMHLNIEYIKATALPLTILTLHASSFIKIDLSPTAYNTVTVLLKKSPTSGFIVPELHEL